jgi:hypothetical protein
MDAVVLGWDPDRGARWVPPYDRALAQFDAVGSAVLPWRIDGEPMPAPGTVVHLMLQGRRRGLVGRGVVRSAPYAAFHADRPGVLAPHVLVAWDHLLPLDEPISAEELAVRVPGVGWGELYAPAVLLPFRAAHELDRVWAAPHPSASPSSRRVALARAALDRVVHDLGEGVRSAERAAGHVAVRVGQEVREDAAAVLGAVHGMADRWAGPGR